MTRPARDLYPKTAERARALGERLRVARLRRRITEGEMAVRVGVSRPTIRRLESGDLTVSLAVLARMLEVLALDSDLNLVAQEDELGGRLTDARLGRPRRTQSSALADEL
ncbi:MAG TPA: helix-turn-helix transcriptional regulator [Candidatus Limnocylindrales bacterium]